MRQSIKRRWLKATLSRAATTFDRTNRTANLLLLTVFCAAAIAMPSCAGTTSTGPTVVAITLLPTQVSIALSQSQQFQAIVTGASNKNVTWFAGGVAGGSATAGTISPSGLYTAPSAMPSPPTVTVNASSNADSSAIASAVVTLTGGIVIAISPTSVTVPTGAGQALTATIAGAGASSSAVTWSVNGVIGGNSILGTIASNGAAGALYVAPAVPPSPSTVSVTVTSVADPSKSATDRNHSFARADANVQRVVLLCCGRHHRVGRQRNSERQLDNRNNRAKKCEYGSIHGADRFAHTEHGCNS